MKKLFAFLSAVALLLMLCACGGNVKSAVIVPVDSDIFTAREIDDANNTAIKYFDRKFTGCTLKEIRYIGDEAAESFDKLAEQYNADDAIVLVSTFDVDSHGGDGSFDQNSTYTDWQWILVKDASGAWRNVDHGYA